MARDIAQGLSNFGFLTEHNPLLADLGATAERLYPFDPASCVLKLRLLAESITQDVASRVGVRLIQPTQAELLRAVDQRLELDPQVRQMFHLLRQRGNKAAHQVDHRIGYREGLEALKVAREIALWFHRSFGSDADFKPGPFILPDDHSQRLLTLQQQVADLTQNLQKAQSEQAAKGQIAELLAAQAAQERVLAERAAEERSVYESLAEEASTRYAALKAEFDAHLQTANAAPDVPTSLDIQAFAQRTTQAVAARQVIAHELVDAALIEHARRQMAHRHPVREVRHAVETTVGGVGRVTAASQSLDVSRDLGRQRAFKQPGLKQGVERRDLGHDGLRWWSRQCCTDSELMSSAVGPSHLGSRELARPSGLRQARTCHNRGLLIMADCSPTKLLVQLTLLCASLPLRRSHSSPSI